MKNSVFKFYIIAFFMLTDFMMFAQPGDEDTNNNLEGNDPPPTPINGKLIFLVIAGIIFAIYTFKNNRKRV